MKKLLFILLLTIPFIGFGQSFEKTFGGTNQDIGWSVQQTLDGGYIITGETKSFGNGDKDVYLIKTDGNGIEQWYQNFGGISNDMGRSVKQTTDGGFIICGSTESYGNGDEDVYLIKTDGNGIEQWYETFGGTDNEDGISVYQTNDGGFIICGSTTSFGNGNRDVWLIKTDGNGVEQWNKTFGGTSLDRGWSIDYTTNGEFIICGSTSSYGNGSSDIYIVKTDGNGNEQWYQTFGGTSFDWGSSVQQTTDGGYIITGGKDGGGNMEVYLIKTDGNGVEQWNKTFGGTSLDRGFSVQQTTDSGYIITGETTSFVSGVYNVYLIKTDGNGNEQWSQTFGNLSGSGGCFVQQTNDGGYIITGSKGGYGGTQMDDYDVYLIKTDGNGNVTSTLDIPIQSLNRKLEKVVDILGRETKPQQNTPFIEIYDDCSTEKKIVIE